MLFILFGGTLETGYRSRTFFRRKGFEVVRKYNYVEEKSAIFAGQYKNPQGVYKDWFNDKVYVTKEEYAKCNFKYGLDGVALGFNRQQIMDAIQGTVDRILTVGASAIEFMEQLKKAYGNYVTLIYLYVEDSCYEKMVSAQPGISDEEREIRIAAGKKMQQVYLKYCRLFDEVVIYTGEGTVFDDQAVADQFDEIIKRRKKVELALNEKQYVQLPYVGSEPYIFVCYSHGNKDQVDPVLGMLQRKGYRIWYDEGISGGASWRLMIKDRIKHAECVLLFSSEESVRSVSIAIEITTACNFEVPVVCVSLDGAEFDETIEEEINQDQKVELGEDPGTFENKIIKTLPGNCRVYGSAYRQL